MVYLKHSRYFPFDRLIDFRCWRWIYSGLSLFSVVFYCAAGPVNNHVVPVVVPHIIRTIPHDPASFTQGLVWYNNELLESTGLVGQSSLRRIQPVTGEVLKNIPIPGVFAEGLTARDNVLIQLTWQDNKAFGYSYPACSPLFTFTYEGEGWGLTSNQTSFIMSNGSDTLYYRDSRFTIVKKLPVSSRVSRLKI